MSVLQGFPLLNQLADTLEPNRQYDCVPTAIAACLEYLLRRPFDGGAIKDAVYGASYVGGTAASQYIVYCHEQDVRLYPIDGEPAQLIAQVHSLLVEGKPSLITIPDPYMPAGSGWTHVEAFHADAPGQLTALDPYGGKAITKSDAEWQGLLLDNQIWAMEKLAMSTLDMLVQHGWKDDGTTLTAPNSVPVVLGFREYVLNHYWDKDNYPVGPQYYTQRLEDSAPDLGDGDQIIFYFGDMLGYPHNPANPDFKGKVIHEYAGKELVKARQQVAALYALVQQLKQAQQPQGVDPAKVRNFQTAAGLQAHQLVQAGQALEQLLTSTQL